MDICVQKPDVTEFTVITAVAVFVVSAEALTVTLYVPAAVGVQVTLLPLLTQPVAVKYNGQSDAAPTVGSVGSAPSQSLFIHGKQSALLRKGKPGD